MLSLRHLALADAPTGECLRAGMERLLDEPSAGELGFDDDDDDEEEELL